MLKFFLCFALVILSSFLYGQPGYRITYKNDSYNLPVSFNGEKQKVDGPTDLLVFNDSMSFSHRFFGDNPFKKRQVFGSKLIHHGVLYHKNTKLIYNMVAWPPGKHNELMYYDSLKEEKWVFRGVTKQINDYTCHAALLVDSSNDSTMVWYTLQIPQPFGPLNYMGFPGLVLEVINKRYNMHLVVKKIERGDYTVIMPTGVRIIAIEERRKKVGK